MKTKKNLLILLDENLNLSEYGIDFICIFMDFGDKTNLYPWRYYVCHLCYGYDEFEIDNGIQFIIEDGFFLYF